jgi:hypothetical protein
MKKTEPITLDAAGYDSLASVLKRAFDQASAGKGKERHANDLPFDQQPMQTIASQFGVGFLLGQAAKKSQESQALPPGRDVAELLGAINYLAGAVIYLETQHTGGAEVVQPVDLEHQLGTSFMTTAGQMPRSCERWCHTETCACRG